MIRQLIAASLVLFALPATAQSPGMDSGWLELVKGERDASSGIEVRDIRRDPATGERYVTVSIPKESMTDTSVMEEVLVMGRRPDKVEINLPEFETRWVEDYDNDNYGLLVRLKDGPETPIRLFFSAAGQGGVMGGPQP